LATPSELRSLYDIFCGGQVNSADLSEGFKSTFSSQYFWAGFCNEDVVFNSDAEFSWDIDSGLDGNNVALLQFVFAFFV